MYPPKNRIIEEFEQIITSSDEKKDEKLYNFYLKHYSYFEKIESISGNKLIAQWIDIKILYIKVLDSKNKYKEAERIYKHLPILLNKLDKDYIEFNRLYINSLLWEGVLLGRLKKYTESNKRFKKLFGIGKRKAFYRKWICSNLHHIYMKYNYLIGIIVLIISFWNHAIFYLGINLPLIPSCHSIFKVSILIIFLLNLIFSDKIINFFVNRKYKIT